MRFLWRFIHIQGWFAKAPTLCSFKPGAVQVSIMRSLFQPVVSIEKAQLSKVALNIIGRHDFYSIEQSEFCLECLTPFLLFTGITCRYFRSYVDAQYEQVGLHPKILSGYR